MRVRISTQFVNGRAVLCVALALMLAGCTSESSETSQYPQRPIKLVVPFGAGGGSDTFGRIIQNAIEEHGLLSQPLVIVNVPGAGGTIGSRRVKNARPDGYTLLLLHEGILTAQHSGKATYGPDAFTPVAGTGDSTQVIAVAESSPFTDLKSLMNEAASQPDTLVFSANIGAPSHFAGLMLETEKPGAKFRYTQNGGGAKRFAALQGGHVQVSAFSIAEYVQFQKSGIRALGLLGEERHADFPALATAKEQGFDVVSQNMQFWWAPRGTDDDRVKVIANAVTQAMQTPEVLERLEEMKMASTVLVGNDLQREINRRQQRIAAVATSEPPALPNFPAIVFATLVALAVLAVVRAAGRRKDTAAKNGDLPTSATRGSAIAFCIVAVATVAYGGVFQWQLLSFLPATAAYVLVVGATLNIQDAAPKARLNAQSFASIAAVALVMSVFVNFLFTKVLFVDLP